jgi:hypothetical protein
LIVQICHSDACDQDKNLQLFPSLQSPIRILIDYLLFKMRIAGGGDKHPPVDG